MLLFSLLMLHRSSDAICQKSMYFIAGMPDYDFRPDKDDEVFISAILKYNPISNHFDKTLIVSDSASLLYTLRYYPDHKKLVALKGKKNHTQSIASSKLSLLEIDVESLHLIDISIPATLLLDNRTYKFFRFDTQNAILDRKFVHFVSYRNNTAKKFAVVFELTAESIKEINYGFYNKILPNGGMAGPFFGSNSDRLLLQGLPSDNKLVIPSYLGEDSVFNTIVPNRAKLSDYYCANLLVNNERITLIYYYQDKNGTPFYDLYNKKLNKYFQYDADGALLNVKNFGEWLCSPTRLIVESVPYQGKQLGSDHWIKNHNEYSLAVSDIIERTLSEVIFSGYLSIRNINDPSIFLEWSTGQADAEILLVEDSVVYYRKHDEIWRVPIENNKLGSHSRILKSKLVPAFHFMFFK